MTHDEAYSLYLDANGNESVATHIELEQIFDQLGGPSDILIAMSALVGTPCKTNRAPPAVNRTTLDEVIERARGTR